MQWLSWFNAKGISFNDVAVVPIKINDYRIYFWYVSKDDAIGVMNNFNLNEKTKEMWY